MRRSKSMIAVIISMLVAFYASVFVIKEGECGIKFQPNTNLNIFDKKPLVYGTGLHFKIPFIQSIKILDARIQTINNQVNCFLTKEKNILIINSYIKWRIKNFSRYFLTTICGDTAQTEVLLKRRFFDLMRSEISKLTVKNIIADSQDHLTSKIKYLLNLGTIKGNSTVMTTPNINLTNSIRKKLVKVRSHNALLINDKNNISELGIEVVDIRIKQINFPKEVSKVIYNRMRSIREAIARYHRSQGQGKAEKIRADADYAVIKTLAKAKQQAKILRGEGEAEAAKLFANAFSQDQDFYLFVRYLRAYENSFQNNQNIMVFNSEKDFFHYLKIPPDKVIQ